MKRRYDFGRLKKTFKIELIAGSSTVNDYSQGRVGAGLHPDGNIYMSPNTATTYIKMNVASGVVSTLISGYSGGGAKWCSNILAQNSMLYSTTANGSYKPLKYDPVTNTAVQIGSLNGYAYGSYGLALAVNGMIYNAPLRAPQVMKINPITGATANIGTSYTGIGQDKWMGITNALNGKLYSAPMETYQILEIDPSTDTTALVGPDFTSLGVGRFGGITIARNGKLYLCPYTSASRIYEFDPVTGTGQYVGPNFTGGAKFYGITQGFNGKLYLIPHSYANFVEYDIDKDIATEIPSIEVGSQKYMGYVNTGNNIYAIPYGINRSIVKITPMGGNVFGSDNIIPSNLANLPTSNYNKFFNKSV